MQVTAQLDGYATATGSCKKEVQRVLLKAVGPAKPSDKTCENSKSTTCSLYYTEQQFGEVGETPGEAEGDGVGRLATAHD
ncbi:hypothetical protein [Microlunatus sp. Gsoil 973]|uniref:hypothetical protein n=1 Tax=Microlunatus sp. Gsoil 973 TaxID=2672569 RepID=UPI0012B4A498|nr:hypothetical protein [Microlunatus sp. Gsoil 973]QGN31475.1 hypothetical protein GJV80_00010 [Microlunatus sp. Gsoil 973]